MISPLFWKVVFVFLLQKTLLVIPTIWTGHALQVSNVFNFWSALQLRAKNVLLSFVGRFDKIGCINILSLQNNMGTIHWELMFEFDKCIGRSFCTESIFRSAEQQTTEDTEHKSIILSLIALPAPEGHTEIYGQDLNIAAITSLLNWN